MNCDPNHTMQELTKREVFALQLEASLINRMSPNTPINPEDLAKQAITLADALIYELSEE